MNTVFKGKKITDEMIKRVIYEFDRRYQHTNDYEQWLEKDSYKFALKYAEKLYPPKHILSEASGISTTKFNGGEQTNRVFRELGFNVIDKPRWHGR